jgi:uncharacterized protein involved in exopolysaccharide biosynthesis
MDLKTIAQVIWNRRWAVAAVIAVGLVLAFIALIQTRATYTATSSVLIVPGQETNDDGVPTTTTKPLLSADLPLLAQTPSVIDAVSRDINGSMSLGELQHNIRAVIYNNSDIMTIRFSAHTRSGAVHGANAVANEVVEYYRTIATGRFDSLAADLKRQLADKEQQLRTIDTKVDALTAAFPYINFGTGTSDATSINAMLVRLEAQRNDISATLSADSAQAQVTQQRTDQAAPLARQEIASQNPFYRNVRDQYGKDAADLRRIETQYAANYPGLPELREIVSREQAGISTDQQRIAQEPLSEAPSYAPVLAEQNRTQALVASDRARLQQIDATIADLKKELTGASNGGTTVAALRRQRDAVASSYQLLFNRLSIALADRAAAASTGSLTIFDRAAFASLSPFSQPAVIFAAVMIVAIWMAITLAFVLEAVDRRFHTPQSIESVYNSPILGVI